MQAILRYEKKEKILDLDSFSEADVKYPGGVNSTLSSGANTTGVFSFIAVGK